MSSATRVTSDLDPFSPEFRADPYSAYEKLRSLGPIVWLEKYDIWAVSHHETIIPVLTDWETYSNAGGGGLANYFKEKPWRRPSIILEVDPPEHPKARAALTRTLSPKTLRAIRPRFEQDAAMFVDAVAGRGEIDAIPELVTPYPLKVFPDSVGMEADGRENLLTYGSMVFGSFGPVTPWYEELMSRVGPVQDWILAHCKREAMLPGGIGEMIYDAVDAGDLTEEEGGLLVRSFLSAGVDTTIDSIGLCLRALAEHPDQWALLREDPSLARAAFEEATRYDSSSQSLFRTTTREVDFAGTTIGKHEKIMCFLGSAGRDPARWENADTFDIRRRTVGQIGFGVGIHGCVGQMFARLEAEVFFQALAARIETLEPSGPSQLRLNPGLRGLSSLPLAITPRKH
ncbi:cytochrome P450 [Neorhizobium alkalisoli]|uniref:Cytochrome P450 n=1 Tax=Neorhizobium alkalisoli TaxID=528178 RepID=A0A561QG83_9HYPH|nr:cytochrome P450 [Neorhizobium alkalisoli]TWF49364.1 cytochrome P450 [Neorhizobium alkalisoli]